MSEQNETVTLSLQQSAKLGVVHVAVTEDGSVVVAGEMRRLDDGETHRFERSPGGAGGLNPRAPAGRAPAPGPCTCATLICFHSHGGDAFGTT